MSKVTKCISVVDLFNAPLTDFIFPVVDIRALDEFNVSHIPSALCSNSFKSYDELLEGIRNLGCEQRNTVCMYDMTSNSMNASIIEFFESKSISVLVLEGGFEAFSKQFPNIVLPGFDALDLILPAYIPLCNMYLGSAMSANSSVLNALQVKSILNAGAVEAMTDTLTEAFHYCLLDMDDSPQQRLEPSLSIALDFMHKQHSLGPVFIHCAQGISRSVSCVIAYLMTYHAMRYDDALLYVKKCRRVVRPNEGFVRQLRELDIQLQLQLQNKKRKVEI